MIIIIIWCEVACLVPAAALVGWCRGYHHHQHQQQHDKRWQALASTGGHRASAGSRAAAGSGSIRESQGLTAAMSSRITVTVSLGPLWNKLISPEGFS